jgi:cobalamin-dependent methionine synthase I
MPVIKDISLTLDPETVLRRGGFQRQPQPQPKIADLLNELLAIVIEEKLLQPAISYEILRIVEVKQNGLYLENEESLAGHMLSSLLGSAAELAVIVCTIGSRLEEKASVFFAQKDPLQSMLLDGIGSAAVDALSQTACQLVQHLSLSLGYQASSHISPGMQDFPIEEQAKVVRLSHGEQIGVQLTSVGIMVPRKSVSMIIGLGKHMPSWTQSDVCARCNLNETCPYKVRE